MRCWRTSISRIRFNPKSIRRVVAWMIPHTRVAVVNVNWNADNGKWNVNDWKFGENDRWNADNRMFS
ncbi:MAG: hypothetical protein PHT88_04115 [Candidatus Moranbacteria bacterium]|nr:hypothetical protein [Candidatus Moranbacteria bacterium]